MFGARERERENMGRDRVKFLCSHGGKILARPSDGQLKYVGGETRMIAVPRNITFSELMNKLTSLFNSDGVLKYQLIPEDLDALVSVTFDEDLRIMFDEFHLHDTRRLRDGRSVRLRAFLFPPMDTHISNTIKGNPDGGLEQRYINAINGIVRTTSDLGFYNYAGSSSRSSSQNSNHTNEIQDTNSSNGVAEASDAALGRYHELQRFYSSPNLLSSGYHQHSHHQFYRHSRLRKPGAPLMTAQSDVARYNIDQLARRYCTPMMHRRGSSEFIGFGQANGRSVNRSGGGLGEGELLPLSPMKQRWGSPLKRSSNRQD